MRYSRDGDPNYINTSINIRTDVHDLVLKYKQDKRLRNKSLTMETLIMMALESEGYEL